MLELVFCESSRSARRIQIIVTDKNVCKGLRNDSLYVFVMIPLAVETSTAIAAACRITIKGKQVAKNNSETLLNRKKAKAPNVILLSLDLYQSYRCKSIVFA